MSTLTTEEIYAIAGGMIGAILAFVVVFYVLLVIAEWKIFNKMGEPGWKSLIPFYNMYTIFKRTWETKWFWIMFGCGIGGSLAMQYTDSSSMIYMFGVITEFCAIALLFTSYLYLSVSFDHKVAFTFFIVFLPNIALLYLGFSKDKYVGNPCDGVEKKKFFE